MEEEEIKQKLNSEVSELDLSRDEDLSIGLMNLISLEEHLFFTHEKTGNEKHLQMLSEIRKIRTDSMEEIVNDTEGEEWCISKHLLSASMRFRETGDKMLDKDREKAKQFYDKAFSLYSMFWAVNFDMGEEEVMEGSEIESGNHLEKSDLGSRSQKSVGAPPDTENGSWLENVRGAVKKAVDCCKEM